MTIIRDGKKIVLTPQELALAHDEHVRESIVEEIKYLVSELENPGLITKDDYEDLVEEVFNEITEWWYHPVGKRLKDMIYDLVDERSVDEYDDDDEHDDE